MNAEQLEQEAANIIAAGLMRLPPGVHSGTARNLVRLLVDAAVARIAEQQPPKPSPDLIPAAPIGQAMSKTPGQSHIDGIPSSSRRKQLRS